MLSYVCRALTPIEMVVFDLIAISNGYSRFNWRQAAISANYLP
jgi:hypothetical protein